MTGLQFKEVGLFYTKVGLTKKWNLGAFAIKTKVWAYLQKGKIKLVKNANLKTT